MLTVQDLAQVRPASPACLTIGVFDGVHRGHQKLIAQMVKAAHTAGRTAAALTFDPHPATALGQVPLPLLTTAGERAAVLSTLGLDLLIVLPFTKALSATRAADFIELLTCHLALVELWCGPNFATGFQREGDLPFLEQLGARCGFAVRVVEPLTWEGAVVSSSRVRAALQAGDIRQAAGCLGRPYRLAGLVVHGDGRGRAIGIPTANLALPPERLIPAWGIYACIAHTERLGARPAAVSIGVRPTFPGAGGRSGPTVEAHLLDLDVDLYGQSIALDFIAYLREERAFSTPDDLVTQIHKDIAQARVVLGETNLLNPDR